MTRLQYAVLHKGKGAVTGARIQSVSIIAKVESVTTCFNAMQSKFMARAIVDPWGIGDIRHGTLLRKHEQSLDGEILRCTIGYWSNPITWGGDCLTFFIFFFFFIYNHMTPHSPSGMAGEPE